MSDLRTFSAVRALTRTLDSCVTPPIWGVRIKLFKPSKILALSAVRGSVGKDIKRCAAQMPGLQMLNKRAFVHHAATCRVDHDCARLHLFHDVRVDHIARAFGQRDMQAYDIGHADQADKAIVAGNPRPNWIILRKRMDPCQQCSFPWHRPVAPFRAQSSRILRGRVFFPRFPLPDIC